MGALITGAAGFIGSNLVEKLVDNGYLTILDKDIKSGRLDNILKDNLPLYKLSCNPVGPKFKVIWDDVLKIMNYHYAYDQVDVVYHLAAASDIKRSLKDTEWDFKNNIQGTYAVLEMMRKKDIKKIIFTSTSAIYGEYPPMPTLENTPLVSSSMYSASKICAEKLIQAYCEIYGFKGWIFRFGNVVGKNQHRGVIYDFLKKLKKNKNKLEILGDGNQVKSYFHVSDCISAMLDIPKFDNNKKFEVYNIATYDWVDVTTLADIICDVLKINPKYQYTGGDRGWKGDIPKIQLSIQKALKTGWKPKYGCEESIKKAVEELV
jgi:UDP-glucose 4-epimerase